jgi:hypothetical protein
MGHTNNDFSASLPIRCCIERLMIARNKLWAADGRLADLALAIESAVIRAERWQTERRMDSEGEHSERENAK